MMAKFSWPKALTIGGGLLMAILAWFSKEVQLGAITVPPWAASLLALAVTVGGQLTSSMIHKVNVKAVTEAEDKANPIKVVTPGSRGFVSFRVLLMVGSFLTACSAFCIGLTACPQLAPVAPPFEQCQNAVLADALAGLTFDQIVAKEAALCGSDALKIIAILLSSSNPSVQATVAYHDAVAQRPPIVIVVDAGGQ